MTARWWNAVVAVLVLIALVLQVIVALRVPGSPHEVTAGVLRGSSTLGRLIRVLSFFTIQSNILCGLTAALLAARPDRDGPVFGPLRLAALFGITVTGIVYSTVLAKIHEPNGTAETIVNDIVHYVVPVLVVVGWLLFGPRPRVNGRVVAWSLVFPAGWTVYTLLRGAIWHWYPYPFVDVSTHGYARVAVNAVLVIVVLGVVAGLFALGDRTLPQPASSRNAALTSRSSEKTLRA